MSSSSSQPPLFPWRTSKSPGDDGHNGAPPAAATASSSNSNLVYRLQAFLPKLQAANASLLLGDNEKNNEATTADAKLSSSQIRIDQDLERQDNYEAQDDEDDDKEEEPPAKRPRRDNDDHNDDDEVQQEQVPTIQLNLTLGVDTHHPVVNLLAATSPPSSSDNHAQSNDETGEQQKDDNHDNPTTASNNNKAERAIQNLLDRRQNVVARAKGPLITEVTMDKERN